MLLAVDVGNSQTVIGAFDGWQLVDRWRVATEADRTADELALAFQGLMGFAGLSFSRNVHGVVISSVVPRLSEQLWEMTRRYFLFDPLLVEPGVRTGVPLHVDEPREVGADRVVNALAAHAEHGGPGVVVDFGTATSFDVYDEQGAFLGGAIAPGVDTSIQALAAHGAQLRSVRLRAPKRAVGRSTGEAMLSGSVLGFAGQVDRIVEEIAAEVGGDPVVVATGGMAEAVLERCRTVDHHDPWLTLKGLRLIWERNLDV